MTTRYVLWFTDNSLVLVNEGFFFFALYLLSICVIISYVIDDINPLSGEFLSIAYHLNMQRMFQNWNGKLKNQYQVKSPFLKHTEILIHWKVLLPQVQMTFTLKDI
jgi:hypothetical protein